MREMTINRFAIVVGVIVALAILLFLPGETIRADHNVSDTVKIGVLAKRGVERCQEKWGPTANYLTEEIPGHSFTIIPLGYNEIYSAVERGEVDFILANPSFYVELEYYYGVSRIATLKNLHAGEAFTVYGGVIFHRADRKDIKCLDDLKGKSFMAVEEESFGGWRVDWRELKEHGIDPHRDFTSLSFGGTHDAVVYAVRNGKVDAGCVRTTTLEQMALEGKVRLEDFQVIAHDHTHKQTCYFPFVHSTDIYPEWPFAKVKHTSDIFTEKVTASLLEMSPASPAALAARCAGWTIPLNYQLVHECLKYLRVGPYKDYGKITIKDMLRQYWPWMTSGTFLLFIIALITFRATRLNRRLRESKKYTQSILNSVQVGIVLIDAETHTIIDANPLAGEMIGVPKEEMIGKICHKFICPAEVGKCPITDLNQIVDNSERVLIRADGTSMTILKTVVPVTVNGRKCLIDSFVDITKRKQAEKEYRESEMMFRTLYDSSSDAIMLMDEKGFFDCNKATLKIFDCVTSEDFLCKHPNELSPPFQPCGTNSMTLANDRIATAMEKGSNRFDWVHIRIKTGEEFPAEVLLNTMEINGKKVLQAVVRDITKRKQAEADRNRLEESLFQSDKMASIGQLAAGVAHEINNPIGFITSNLNTMNKYLQKLIEHFTGDNPKSSESGQKIDIMIEDFGDAISESLDGADRVKKIVADLKSFSRVDAGEVEYADLNEGLETTLNIVWNQLKYKCKVEKEFGNIPQIECFPNRINQVFMNLLVNAGHAIENESGVIRIKTWVADDHVHVSFRDNGCGIPKENLSKLFDAFFTTKEVGKGTGLGLSLVYNIVSKHGGTITVDSEVGKGTEFVVTLPISSTPEPVSIPTV